MAAAQPESVPAYLMKVDVAEWQLEAVRLLGEDVRALEGVLRERMAHTDRKFSQVADTFRQLDEWFRKQREKSD